MVHFYRNVFSHVPNAKVKEVARMLKAIHAQESLASAQTKAADRGGSLLVDSLCPSDKWISAALIQAAWGSSMSLK
jgi:transposase-like protein